MQSLQKSGESLKEDKESKGKVQTSGGTWLYMISYRC